MDGTQRIGEGQLAPLDPAWQVVGAGDYNGDGRADILWRHSSGTNVSVVDERRQRYRRGRARRARSRLATRRGAGTTTAMAAPTSCGGTVPGRTDVVDERHPTDRRRPLTTLGPAWQVVGAGDYNGDGHADILWRHSSGTNDMWLMNGTQIIGGGQLPTVDPAWQIVGAGDYNGDGQRRHSVAAQCRHHRDLVHERTLDHGRRRSRHGRSRLADRLHPIVSVEWGVEA